MRDGLVVVDKEVGWTSHDVVAKLRGVYGQRRVGHAGTLDPGARGVLLVGLGRVTRLLRFLPDEPKVYTGVVVFGIATDTLDAEGAVVAEAEMPLRRADVERAAARFVGSVEQVPPMVSAVKVGGRRLHELARAGLDVERPARTVQIDRLDVTSFEAGAHPRAAIRVVCSSGTYVRTLAADLGAALGGPAHLRDLVREACGAFTLDDARTVSAVAVDPDAALLDPADALRGLARRVVDGETARAVGHGAPIARGESAGDAGPVAICGPDGALLGVYEPRGEELRPLVVLGPAGARA